MDDKLSIRVNVADRFYPLKIERKDEETIRKAAKLINDRVQVYKQHYADKDTQDFLAMAALQFVIKVIENEQNEEAVVIADELNTLTQEIETLLDKE
jgi:cell division protein ZapA (FtsZ GTPase activity inhibitor)